MPETGTWTAPECPFAIDYSLRALDQIRIAVSDAFYSVPRGGVEIGGLLLGSWQGSRLAISGYRHFDCEHASGPSFTLSARDRERLAELIASEKAGGAQVAGWYHSHTRSEIFLSQADLELHRDFFPQPWQVALVLKPHTLTPTRAGFFFRDAGGAVHARTPHDLLTLNPLETKALPAPVAQPIAPLATAAPAPVVAAAPMPDPEAADAAATFPSPLVIPSFAAARAPAPRRWPRIVIPIAIGAAIGAPVYWKRDQIAAAFRPVHAASPPPVAQAPARAPVALGLNTIEVDGQLQIRWNRNSPAIGQSAGGTLRISGAGPSSGEIALDRDHLLSGAFTVTRNAERVDISLAVNRPNGPPVTEATSFVGSLPEKQTAAPSPDVSKLRADLDGEIERNRKLQRDVDFLAKQLREQQRARLLNQAK